MSTLDALIIAAVFMGLTGSIAVGIFSGRQTGDAMIGICYGFLAAVCLPLGVWLAWQLTVARCPQCRGIVSRQASRCRHCRAALATSTESSPTSATAPRSLAEGRTPDRAPRGR